MEHTELKAALPAIESAYAAAREAFTLANESCHDFDTPPVAHVEELVLRCANYHAAGNRLDEALRAIIKAARAQEGQP